MPLFSFKKSSKQPQASKPTQINSSRIQDIATTDGVELQRTRYQQTFEIKYTELRTTPLEIRLLWVHRSEKHDPIRCTILHTCLPGQGQQHIAYETVSYCWGEWMQHGCLPLWLGPLEALVAGAAVIEIDQVPVTITNSAAEVIQRVRSPLTDRYIWIDAICINQGDKDERAQQVALMAKIYKGATTNLVWLGHDEGYGEYINQEMNRALADFRRHSRAFVDIYTMTHDNMNMKRDGTVVDRTIDFKALTYLYESPWFGRLWIAQEVALARNSICYFGRTIFQLRDILKVALWMVYNSQCLPTGVAESIGVHNAVVLWHLVDRSCIPREDSIALTSSLYSLHRYLREFKTSEERDYVYAMLGLLVMTPEDRDLHRAALKIDYTKAVGAVFRDATRAFIETSRTPDVLQVRTLGSNGSQSLGPSWSLDLRSKLYDEHMTNEFFGDYDACHGLLMSPNTFNDERGVNVLSLKGFDVDEVSGRTEEPFNSRDDQQFLNTLRQAVGLWRRSPQAQRDGHNSQLSRTLIADANWLGDRASVGNVAEYESFQNYIAKHRRLPPTNLKHALSDYDQKTQEAIRFFTCAARACHRRRFFLTKCGLFGLGPATLLDHDRIVILYGGTTPFAIREADNGKHVFVGECYVFGIMEGQAVRDYRAAGRHHVRFELV
ncbi:hypothetical protein AC578_1910 [Pseudocercospora eumusae]|uniref:Heterokaryon incompatibility domain-containing protein n=1 Tax=Pseudocercospora eumusae TaxID=321146 RepID=A0A139HDL6_9PEZI|nr:hypothetical protein AC578_1910 [Pseudocercospora eumusae]